jgi:hypothetical protein
LSYTTVLTRKFKVSSVHFHFDAAVTETIVITFDSKQGSDYDTVLKRTSLSGATDYVWRPEVDCDFQAGDKLKIQCTNANLTGNAFALIKLRELE